MRRLGLLLVLAAGCTLGPDYKRPATQPPPSYRGGADTADPTSLADQDWAQVFPDPALADLIHVALAPTRIHTGATVTLDKIGDSFAISRIDLETTAEVPGLDDQTFQRYALEAKRDCPVSKALAGTTIHLTAKLV